MRYVIVTLGAVLAALLGFAVASCGSGAQSAGDVPTGQVTGDEPVLTDTGIAGTDSGSGTSTSDGLVRYKVWFHRGEQLYPVTRTRAATPRIGSAALGDLLVGPSTAEHDDGVGTQIPDGTELLGLAIDHGIATVDLTSEYESGGGTASMTMRLAQVVCTLDQFPTVRGVLFQLDGQAVDVLGGEGIVIDHPLRCRDYRDLLPTILVTSPASGQTVANPVTITGSANVFEANVTVEVLDATGDVVGNGFTTATCGSGCRGTFTITLSYDVAKAQKGELVIHDDDAAGTGQPPHEVRLPVFLQPAS
jgi:germination protein M